jgi:hypothetical protein
MDDEIVTITGARYKRSDYMDETGIPSHGVDLVYIEEDHDLTWAVLPLWDQAGIVYQCYSQGGGGDMMMIRDEDRYEEAKDIAHRGQLELEARHLRRMAEVLTGKSSPYGYWELLRRIEDIHDLVQSGNWTVDDARKALGLITEPQ